MEQWVDQNAWAVGVAYFGIIALGATLFAVGSVRAVRQFRRDMEAIRSGHKVCSHCGYWLRGNVSGVCPECGAKVGE